MKRIWNIIVAISVVVSLIVSIWFFSDKCEAYRRKKIKLSGIWHITDSIEQSSIGKEGTIITFEVRFTQIDGHILGKGNKIKVDRQELELNNNRTVIEIDGSIDYEQNTLNVTIMEGGQRKTTGSFDWEILNNSSLKGRFESDAAKTKGSSVCEKVNINN